MRSRSVLAGLVGIAAVASTFALSACESGGSGSSEAPSTAGTTPIEAVPGVIVDTDFSLWWDDATAVGLANVLHDRGEIRLLAVVSDVPNGLAVAAIDAVNTAYGHGDVPLGAVAGSEADTFSHGYTDALVARLPHSVDRSDDVPDAVSLYRRLLADAPDRSVTIVALGAYTNLAALLESPRDDHSSLDGRALVEQKVKRLVIMDGLFPEGGVPLTNQELDLEAATVVIEGWPTPIAWFDGLGGIETRVGGTLCTAIPPEHPMRIVYEELFGCEPPGDGNWDAPALLYAVDDVEGVFTELGHEGGPVLNEQGGLSWEASSRRAQDVYVRVFEQEALNRRIEELLVAG